MIRYMCATLLLLVAFGFSPDRADAACTGQTVSALGQHIYYTNDCEDDNEVLIDTGDLSVYDVCALVTLTGVADVLVSLDGGDNYTTAPLSMTDKGGTSTNPVIVTVALRLYVFPVTFTHVRVLQNGGTDAEAQLRCSNLY